MSNSSTLSMAPRVDLNVRPLGVALFLLVLGAWYLAQAVSGQRIVKAKNREPGEWTFAIPSSYPWAELSPSAKLAMARGVQALRQAGARVVNVDLPLWVGDAFSAHDAVQGWEAARALALEIDTAPTQLSALLRDYLLASRQISDEAYAAAQGATREAQLQCSSWFAGIDVLLTPSAPDEAPEGYGSTGASTFNRAWTLLGTPCLSVPGVSGVNGRPMGLQVIARPGADGACLAAGEMLERLLKA